MNLLEIYGLNDRFGTEATMFPQFSLARITAQHRGLYEIVTEQGEFHAEISGKLRYETTRLSDYPVVGDFVMVSAESMGGKAVIHSILNRKSLFLRTAVGLKEQAQCVAANIDTVFICMSCNNNFNLSRLERYLGVAWDSGATPVILLTKSDLCEDLEGIVKEVERISPYSDVIPLSVFEDGTEQKLAKYLQIGTTSAFIGSSGVGKSTLINKLLGKQALATADTGKADKGRHTTTGREMFISPFGGVLIDTPGMRELGVESVDLEKTFVDIEELAGQCRFADCTHTKEPGCAILEAIRNGTLDERRYRNYCKLKTEVGYDGLDSKQIMTKKAERMFRDIGGLKNFNKFVKQQHKNKGK